MRSHAERLSVARLPSRFPVGTRFIIEGRNGRIDQKYLEFPDGRQISLPTEGTVRGSSRRRIRRVGARK
jgi:hypothetical protein